MNQNVKQLLIMRHAKSSWDDERLTDYERPLNDRGRLAAPLMGRHLREHNITVDVVLASSALRVKETLTGLMPEWQCAAEIVWEKSLYMASLERLLNTIAGLHNNWRSVMLVGHNPGLSKLLSHLTNEAQHLPTAAIAVLDTMSNSWPESLANRPWHQVACWKPKEFES